MAAAGPAVSENALIRTTANLLALRAGLACLANAPRALGITTAAIVASRTTDLTSGTPTSNDIGAAVPGNTAADAGGGCAAALAPSPGNATYPATQTIVVQFTVAVPPAPAHGSRHRMLQPAAGDDDTNTEFAELQALLDAGSAAAGAGTGPQLTQLLALIGALNAGLLPPPGAAPAQLYAQLAPWYSALTAPGPQPPTLTAPATGPAAAFPWVVTIGFQSLSLSQAQVTMLAADITSATPTISPGYAPPQSAAAAASPGAGLAAGVAGGAVAVILLAVVVVLRRRRRTVSPSRLAEKAHFGSAAASGAAVGVAAPTPWAQEPATVLDKGILANPMARQSARGQALVTSALNPALNISPKIVRGASTLNAAYSNKMAFAPTPGSSRTLQPNVGGS